MWLAGTYRFLCSFRAGDVSLRFNLSLGVTKYAAMGTGINTSYSEAFICLFRVYFADHVLHVRRKDANALKERANYV